MEIFIRDVVRVARSFIGTRFGHQGRRKGWALDCVGLPLCTAEELGILDRDGIPLRSTDHMNYPPQPTGMVVHAICVKRLIKKDIAEMCPGDVLTILSPNDPIHTAIVTELGLDWGLVVHATNTGRTLGGLKTGRIVERRIDDALRKKIFGVFSFPGVC